MRLKQKISENKRSLSKNESVKLYKKILNGKLDRFPRGYWNDKDKEAGGMCARYLIEIVLMLEGEEIYNLSRYHFKTYMLSTMLEKLFNNDIYTLIEYIYPEKYFEWKFIGGVKEYWTKETISKVIRFNIESREWSKEAIVGNYSKSFIKEIGLEYAIKKVYKNNMQEALEDAYPGRFKKWEINVRKGFWTKETGIEATRWMIDELEWTELDIKSKLTKKVFKDMGLESMLKILYNDSPYQAINDAYPGTFSQYELRVPKGYWTRETGSKAVKDMIENKLCYSYEEVKSKLDKKDFKKFKLEYMVSRIYDGDYYEAINDAYPGVYRRYELRQIKFREKRTNELVKYLSFFD